MRRVKAAAWLFLGAVVVLSGCVGEPATETVTAGETQPPADVAETASFEPGDADFWADIPVCPDAERVESLPAGLSSKKQMGEYRQVEFRHWKTGAEVGEVADFYLAGMPEEGWTNILKMDFGRPQSAMSSWVQRDGEVAASVSVGRDSSGKVYLTIMRAEGAG